MELDDFKAAWRTLDARLATQESLQLELMQGQRSERARRNLRPLLLGMALQALLGIGLVVLGIACWKQNLDNPGLLAAGIVLHAFGVMHVVFAGLVAALASTLDCASPVLVIQKRLRLLLRMQVLNSNACGMPWWIMWVVVVVAFAGLSPGQAGDGTPTWVWGSLAVVIAGLAGTWIWSARAARRPGGLYHRVDDGTGGIRRNLRLFDDIERFDRD